VALGIVVCPQNRVGVLVQRAVLPLLSIFPASLTDSFRARGIGGKIAGRKVNAESKMTTDFQLTNAKMANDE
jgi:hypothetical protein